MFVCVLGVDDAIRERLRRWQAAAWPDGTELSTGNGFILTDGRTLSAVRRLGRSTLGCVDGLDWSNGGNEADDVVLGAMKSGRWPLPPECDGSYSAVCIDAERSVMRVDVDPIGLRRVFAGGSPQRWVVSSLQVPAALALGLGPDAVGIAQILGTNYTLGRRTLFEGLEEVLPGESWEFGPAGRRLIGWEPAITDDGKSGVAIEAVSGELAGLYRRSMAGLCRRDVNVGLALSGGLDSRLVLGGLLAAGREPSLFTWGQRDEYEFGITTRCAQATGLSLDRLDLARHLFPSESAARAFSLANEALLHPGWVGLGSLFGGRGVDVIATGNVTDSFQVRIGGLWSRRARLWRGAHRLLGRPPADLATSSEYSDADEWWSRRLAQDTGRARAAVRRYGIGVAEDEVANSTASDLEMLRNRISSTSIRDAVRVEDALHLLTCRQVHGSQPQAASGGAIGLDLTATRHLGRAALSFSPALRSDRVLIDSLARRILPRALARIPTATIPLVPAVSPLAAQYILWGGRFAADQAIRWANSKCGGRLGRDRLFQTLDLYSAYRFAGEDHYLAGDWGTSQAFDVSPFRDEFLSVVRGDGSRPMYPFRIHLAVRLDTMLSHAARRV